MSAPVKVLLVEDDPDDYVITKDLLDSIEGRRFELAWAQTYEDAFETFVPGAFDVGLIDMRLGDRSGIELIGAIADERAAPLIMLTGSSSPESDTAALHAGAADFLVKGRIDSALLDRSIRYAIQRRALELRLREAQKLESLGVLAGGIAHDFNNLLVGVLGNASLALSDLPSDSPARVSIEQVEVAAMRAAELARQLLAYAGKGRFVVGPLDVGTLVRETGSLAAAGISKGIRIRYDLADGLPAIDADASQIRQVVMNLLTNAAESMNESGGTIEVRGDLVAAIPGEGYRFGAELPPGPYLRLEVQDTGLGMDADDLARLFDPFFSTKFTGRGLGLAAVLGILRGHRAAVRVTSAPDVGSTFSLLFPCSDEVLVAESPAPGRRSARTSPATVLVADDEPVVREIARRMLEGVGYTVLLAEDGAEAVRVARERRGELDIVLLDLMMPGLPGEQVIEQLLEISAEVPVVLSSGYNANDLSERFVDSKLAGFLQKPYRREDLLEQIGAALASAVSSTGSRAAAG